MSIVLQSTGGGSVTIQEPATASNLTATLPAATGTVMVSGNMPAFSAGMSGNQSISSGVFTKVQFSVENWDTANCYDNATNYRFTPNVAGYYTVTASIDAGNSASAGRCLPSIYKNGSAYRNGTNIGTGSGGFTYSGTVSAQVYLNGTTDYIEIYAYVAGTTPVITGSPNAWFDAVLSRGA